MRWPPLTGTAWGVLLPAFVLIGPARGGDGSAVSRLDEARAAYAAALAALQAAEAELKAVEAEEQSAPTGSAVDPVGNPVQSTTELPAPLADGTAPGYFAWSAWSKSITFGLNGSAGSSDSISGHLMVGLEREIRRHKTRIEAVYRASQRDGHTTENRVRLDVRHDWLPPDDGRWRWWIKGTYEYDEFQAWDHRASGHAGFGYEMLEQAQTSLVWRMGLGGSQTFGGPEDDFAPEALLTGVDFAKDIRQDQRLVFGTELFFDLREAEDYRINSSMNYEITIDRQTGMILRTGVDHRFESEPAGGAERSDFNYFMSLGWRF